jgi:hypothetical protein
LYSYNKNLLTMIKKLLLTGAIATASITGMKAQLSSQVQPADPFTGKHFSTTTQLHKGGLTVATANCVDTNYYVDTKNFYKNPSQNYVTYPSNPAVNGGVSLGYSYANSGTITVTGLGFIARSTNTTVTTPSKAYLYNVNATGVPTTKIDSISLGVNIAKYYYGTIGSPRVITGNFAVVVRADYTATTQTLSIYMAPANTSTAATNNFGEGRGYFNAPTAGGWYTMNAVFGGTATPTADYEPIAFPIYSYNMTSDYIYTPASPMCLTSTLSNTNTSVNSAVAENYMFNVSRFCKKWGVAATGLDSVYTWNFSDGTGRFTNKNQNHNYTVTGTFNDSLTVKSYAWSFAANCIDRKINPITVVAQPTITISPASSTVCTGATATLTASGATSYAWQGGQATASATFAPSSNSTYSVAGTNACGTASAFANVAVTAVAVINAATTSTAICSGQSSTLTVSGASTYTWSPSTSLSSANGAAVVATPAATTIYTITGTSSCGTASTTVTQNVNATPSVSVAASASSVCAGTPVTFNASGATTYSWMPGGPATATYSVNPTTSSTYTVMGTTAGCASTKTVALTVAANPTLSVSSSTTTICAGSSATLTVTGNGVGYLWSTGAMTPVIVVSPTLTTVYSVTTANTSSCVASATRPITVVTCTATGIDELSGTSVNVYPNPNTGVLHIAVSSELASGATVQIYDVLGKLVIAQSLSAEHTIVNTAALSNGVYIFKVVKGEQPVKIGRLIKQ